jgi:folylpolyglutamate synthase/dihydropteroate synthase
MAQEDASGGVVVVSGSVYLVGEVRAMLTGEFAVGKSETR